MRYSLILSAGLVPLASAASNVCSTGLLPLFAPLSTWPAAVSYCSSKYPASSTTVTITAPATLTTTTVTSTQTLQPTPYYKKKRSLERRKAWQRFRENMIKAGLDPRAVSTTTPPPTGTAVATVTGVAPTPVTPTPITPTTTVITKATTTATSKTTTTTAACGTGKAALFCTLVAQASTLISQFCSCYDPAPTVTATTTVTPTTTITTFTLETTTAPQLIASCPTVDRLDPTDPFGDILFGTGCTSFNQNTRNPVNCRCNVRAGGDLNGPGVCSSGYYPNEPCTTDGDCPNGRHCLGYPDPNSQSYLYYCSITQTCANGGVLS